MSNTHFSPLNDSEVTLDIQTSKDISETGMAFPREIPSKLLAKNDEEQNPLQYLPPDGSSQHPEQFEMVPVDQMNLLDGPQIVHEYTNLLCCYYYKQIRRIKKKEDIEAGRPNKVTRVIETKEWLLSLDPVSDEIYFWCLKASFWTILILVFSIYAPKFIHSFYWFLFGDLELGSEAFWINLAIDFFVGLMLTGITLLLKRWMRNILRKNDLTEAKKNYKSFVLFPFFYGVFYAYYTYNMWKDALKKPQSSD